MPALIRLFLVLFFKFSDRQVTQQRHRDRQLVEHAAWGVSFKFHPCGRLSGEELGVRKADGGFASDLCSRVPCGGGSGGASVAQAPAACALGDFRLL